MLKFEANSKAKAHLNINNKTIEKCEDGMPNNHPFITKISNIESN